MSDALPTGIGARGLRSVRSQAETLARDAGQALAAIDRAWAKAGERDPRLAELRDDFLRLLRMARAYYDGGYREVPWGAIVAILGAALYLVNPFDLIPDFLAVIGLLDDAAVIALVVRGLRRDLQRFEAWEKDKAAS